jgi:hypothetical protein
MPQIKAANRKERRQSFLLEDPEISSPERRRNNIKKVNIGRKISISDCL